MRGNRPKLRLATRNQVTAILLRTCCLWNFEGKFQFVFQFSLENELNLYAIYCVWVCRESSSAKTIQPKRRRNTAGTSTLVTEYFTKDNKSDMVEEQANMICQGVKIITLSFIPYRMGPPKYSSLKYDFV